MKAAGTGRCKLDKRNGVTGELVWPAGVFLSRANFQGKRSRKKQGNSIKASVKGRPQGKKDNKRKERVWTSLEEDGNSSGKAQRGRDIEVVRDGDKKGFKKRL